MKARKKLFFDTEFTGLHKNTTLISIGIIAESGETFYAELTDYDKTQIDKWLEENVIANLILDDYKEEELYTNKKATYFKGSKAELSKHLRKWLEKIGLCEFWSDCLSFDWVLFVDIFEHAFKVPDNVLYIPFDICTLFKDRGIDPDISREEFAKVFGIVKHNALDDAIVIQECYNILAPEANKA